ncbi:MAG TPA: sulfate adenylyltransferase, partial [Nitrososphaeraceae archaeon]
NCPHSPQFKEELKGRNIRKMVSLGEIPAEHLLRPEIAKVILSYKDVFVQ